MWHCPFRFRAASLSVRPGSPNAFAPTFADGRKLAPAAATMADGEKKEKAMKKKVKENKQTKVKEKKEKKEKKREKKTTETAQGSADAKAPAPKRPRAESLVSADAGLKRPREEEGTEGAGETEGGDQEVGSPVLESGYSRRSLRCCPPPIPRVP